jgi:Leucine-rich repeat (LRR) protein
MYRNQLTSLPAEIGELTALTLLDVGENGLTVLPTELGKLNGLEDLWVQGNPLVVPPPEVVAQGTAAILEYLRQPRR